MSTIDNKRIAKNTMFLYIRMGLTMIVNLYTIRVIWQVLGVDNYGIYNVVGGIVLMFQFLNNAMVSSSQRFISYELGTGNFERLKRVFSASVKVHLFLSIIILLLAETVGLWFLNYKLNIPVDRIFAANCVYQSSIISFLIMVVSVPYNACIVAHEHMKVYGYLGVLEVSLKLAIVFLLMFIPYDKLISYAVLVLCVQIIMRVLYQLYCRNKFPECRLDMIKDNKKDKDIVRGMFSFAGWSFLGNMGFSFRDQGLNIILNVFFNVAMNAAKGIATQASNAINGFAMNFTIALNPQITKSYAAGHPEDMLKLMFRGCKFSFILLSIIVIPIINCCEEILKLWLDNVEEYTIGFLRIMLLTSLVDAMVSPITTSLQAIGNIRRFQIIISMILLFTIPVAWLWLHFDRYPYAVAWILLGSSIIALIARLILLKEQVDFSIRSFLIQIFSRTYIVAFIEFLICRYMYSFECFHGGLWQLIVFVAVACIICLLLSFLSLTRDENAVILKELKAKICR